MKILKIVGAALAVLVVLFLAVPAVLRPDLHLERSIEVAASPEKTYEQVADWEKFKTWNPFAEMDPTTQATTNGLGLGSTYEWTGEKTGKGRMTVASMDPGKRIDYDMDFIEPMPGKATSYFTFEPTEAGTRVTWGFDESLSYFNRYFGLLTDLMMGPAFEKGLQNLKAQAEAQ